MAGTFRILLILAIACFAGQKTQAQTSPPTDLTTPATGPVATLSSVLESIQSVDASIDRLNAARTTASPDELETINEEIRSLSIRRDELRGDFETIATGIAPPEFDQGLPTKFDLRQEVDKLIRPLVEELNDLTAKPREIEQLRSDLSNWKRRGDVARRALENLAAIPSRGGPDLSQELVATRTRWEERLELSSNRARAIEYQLEQAESTQPGLYESVRDAFRSFFRSRGRNLFFFVIVFLGVFFGLRYLHRRVEHYGPWRRKGALPFYVRLIDVGLHIFSLVAALAAAMFVLYVAGDWVLMGFAIIVLIGLILAAKNGLPKFYDHVRLLLNLGEIREGERVVYHGIPWKVQRLTFFTVFKNERLRGGELRLPLREVRGLVSRPPAEEGELWFPTAEGDWVDLPDHGKARVISQSPEFVNLVKLGGARITMPTVKFIEACPVNLSGGFRISSVIGIDYAHQAEATGKIPEKMWAYLTRELGTLAGGREGLHSLKVEFANAGSSSLDLAIIADFDGELAARYEVFSRAMQRLAVECCQANGWNIPFTQITLHQAKARD